MIDEEYFKPYNIIDNVYIGNDNSCRSNKIKNIRVIHLVESEFETELRKNCFRFYNKKHIEYVLSTGGIYFNFKDSNCYTDKQLMFIINVCTRYYTECDEDGKSLLIHCLAGINRTPFIACGILLNTRKVKSVEQFKEILKFPYSKGSRWQPLENWLNVLKKLENDENLLHNWEKSSSRSYWDECVKIIPKSKKMEDQTNNIVRDVRKTEKVKIGVKKSVGEKRE